MFCWHHGFHSNRITRKKSDVRLFNSRISEGVCIFIRQKNLVMCWCRSFVILKEKSCNVVTLCMSKYQQLHSGHASVSAPFRMKSRQTNALFGAVVHHFKWHILSKWDKVKYFKKLLQTAYSICQWLAVNRHSPSDKDLR